MTKLAGSEGLEPPQKVLETIMLPLHYDPVPYQIFMNVRT